MSLNSEHRDGRGAHNCSCSRTSQTLFTGIVGPKIKLRITLIGSDVDVVGS